MLEISLPPQFCSLPTLCFAKRNRGVYKTTPAVLFLKTRRRGSARGYEKNESPAEDQSNLAPRSRKGWLSPGIFAWFDGAHHRAIREGRGNYGTQAMIFNIICGITNTSQYINYTLVK